MERAGTIGAGGGALALTLALAGGCSCGADLGTGRDAAVGRDGSADLRDGARGDAVLGDGAMAGDAAASCGTLMAVIRDFHRDHPDFEAFVGTTPFTGIVEDALGADETPVYAAAGSTPRTTGPAEFAQWYHDVAGVNESFSIELPLSDVGGGLFVFDDSTFFPIDAMGFGDEGSLDSLGDLHNFHFTTEVHTAFVYRGGETFTFTGDDDLWLFINGHLAIDLGGTHPSTSATAVLDTLADTLGIEVGGRYRMDIFHAERHTDESNFRVETTIDCFMLI